MPSLKLGVLELLASPYSAQVGTSWGAWESISTATSSLFLDGSVVSGEATGNRQVTLKVMVDSPSRPELIGACEALIGEANKASNTITFTPDVGPSIVYEVFRASKPERVDDEAEAFTRRTYQLTFPALPFARSATRETPAALAPAVTFEDFEANFAGAMLTAVPTAGSATMWVCPVGSAATTPLVAKVAGTDMAASLAAVTNVAGITYPVGAKTSGQVTAGAAGVVEFRTAGSWAVSGDMVTVAMNVDSAGSGAQLAVAGVEWLDSGGATLRTDWGTPARTASLHTFWAASRIPAGAVSVRVRVRVPAGTAGQVINVREIIAVPSTLGTVSVSATAKHDGVKGLDAALVGAFPTSPSYVAPGYLFRALAAPVTVASDGRSLSVWVDSPNAYLDLTMPNGEGAISARLFDSAGRWSRFRFIPAASIPTATWAQLFAVVATPYQSSDAGAAVLTDVVAYDVDVRSSGGGAAANIYLDTIQVIPTPAAALSLRGTVFNLTPILGSARTTAAVTVSSGSALTDWLVAAIDGTTGPPLLAVASNVATVAAPAVYSGVYSVLGCIAPSTVLAAPTCTVVQKIGATTVATRILTGTTRVGDRYVDFGAVELPLVATPPQNLGVSYTFTLAPASASWVEVLVIDVDASLAWVDNMATPLPVGWVDEPDMVAGLGKVWVGTNLDRSDARALALPLTMSRPLQVKAPSTRLLVYSTTTAPNVMLTYYPRWLVEPS